MHQFQAQSDACKWGMQKQNVYPAGRFALKSSSGAERGHRKTLLISADAGMLLTTSDWKLKTPAGKMDPDTSKT